MDICCFFAIRMPLQPSTQFHHLYQCIVNMTQPNKTNNALVVSIINPPHFAQLLVTSRTAPFTVVVPLPSVGVTAAGARTGTNVGAIIVDAVGSVRGAIVVALPDPPGTLQVPG